MFPKGMHPGATWKKTDLQIHTPRDPNWTGSAHLPGVEQKDKDAREAWADTLVAACLARGLSVIAITDHHDFCFVEYVRRAIERLPASTEKPWLFPGAEITCDDSAQCLILFDAGSTQTKWHPLFGGHLQSVAAPDETEPRSPQAQLCGRNVKEFLEGVASDTELSNCSIVLPHASNGGHKTIIRVGFQARFRSLPFDGVYAEKKFSDLDESAKRKIYGEILEWGDRRRGVITTGDNRKASFSELGSNPCWIRLGEPTAEAIRQALLADKARIAYEEPSRPNQRIIRLDVHSTLTGSDLSLSINDGFTALIGGRGSGKSAILEYLRYGLGRSAGDIKSDIDDRRIREQELIADTLSGGFARVTLERDGVVEIWERSGAQRDIINVLLPDGSNEQLTVPAAQERFRARAFYQKQLSTLVSDRETAAEQITGIAAAESVDRIQTAEKEIAAAKRQIQADFQQLQEFWVAQSEHARAVASSSDLKRRIDAVARRLEESGLSTEHQKLLETAPLYNSIGDLISEARASVEADLGALEVFREEIPSIPTRQWEIAKDLPEVAEFLGDLATADVMVDVAADQVETALKNLGSGISKLAISFGVRKKAFDLQHQAAVAQQANLKSLLDESSKLVEELKASEAAERRSATRLEKLSLAPDALAKSRQRLTAQSEACSDILRDAASKVEQMSAGSLRASVKTEEQPEQYEIALSAICEGNRIRDFAARCEERLKEVEASPDLWGRMTGGVLEIYKHKVQNAGSVTEPPEQLLNALGEALLGARLTPQQSSGTYAKLVAAHVGTMLTAIPSVFINFEYKDASGYIPFERASPGQQAAALLNLLLNQEAGTLIIDQPEDDLDNRVIIDIIELLQTTKRRLQLIFATHNPNFVVNGDADKVVALTPGVPIASVVGPRISIEVDGSIETPAGRWRRRFRTPQPQVPILALAAV